MFDCLFKNIAKILDNYVDIVLVGDSWQTFYMVIKYS